MDANLQSPFGISALHPLHFALPVGAYSARNGRSDELSGNVDHTRCRTPTNSAQKSKKIYKNITKK